MKREFKHAVNASCNSTLVLASASPRRAALLEQIGVAFIQRPADIVEYIHINEPAQTFVARMAKEKAHAVFTTLEGELNHNELSSIWVLASDTSIVLDNKVLGKPDNFNHAVNMWQAMSGRKHQVLTSLCLMSASNCYQRMSENDVEFSEISAAQMEAYWQSGEPQDKAGAYGIQGKAALWIESISGSYSSIMGLPLFETGELLTLVGFDLWPECDENDA